MGFCFIIQVAMRLLAPGLIGPRCVTLPMYSALGPILTSTYQIQCTSLHSISLALSPIYIHESQVTP
jgi:hypothetical protein